MLECTIFVESSKLHYYKKVAQHPHAVFHYIAKCNNCPQQSDSFLKTFNFNVFYVEEYSKTVKLPLWCSLVGQWPTSCFVQPLKRSILNTFSIFHLSSITGLQSRQHDFAWITSFKSPSDFFSSSNRMEIKKLSMHSSMN